MTAAILDDLKQLHALNDLRILGVPDELGDLIVALAFDAARATAAGFIETMWNSIDEIDPRATVRTLTIAIEALQANLALAQGALQAAA